MVTGPVVTENSNGGKSVKDSREERRMVAKGGALAGLDLSLKLTPRQEEVRLAAAQAIQRQVTVATVPAAGSCSSWPAWA